jgi:hypothetical protein
MQANKYAVQIARKGNLAGKIAASDGGPEFFRMSRETKASSLNSGAIYESSRMADILSSALLAIIAVRKAAKVAAWQKSRNMLKLLS